jgi:hypothetical protein
MLGNFWQITGELRLRSWSILVCLFHAEARGTRRFGLYRVTPLLANYPEFPDCCLWPTYYLNGSGIPNNRQLHTFRVHIKMK